LTLPDYAKAVLGKLVNWAFVAENLDGNGLAARSSRGLKYVLPCLSLAV
jgi:hypothetical protein